MSADAGEMEETPGAGWTSVKRRLACTICRKSKLRCDWYEGKDKCSRCAHLGLVCESALPAPSALKRAASQSPSPAAAGTAQRPRTAAARGGERELAAYDRGDRCASTHQGDCYAHDLMLDCESTISAIVGERPPVELLREWALAAIHRRDCSMLGRAMARTARAGYSMPQVLGARATAPHVMREFCAMMLEAEAHETGACARLPPMMLSESTIPRALMLRSLDAVPSRASLLLVRSCIDGVVQFAADAMFEAHVMAPSQLTVGLTRA